MLGKTSKCRKNLFVFRGIYIAVYRMQMCKSNVSFVLVYIMDASYRDPVNPHVLFALCLAYLESAYSFD